MKQKAKIKTQKVVRKNVKAGFLKILFSEFYSPTAVAKIKYDRPDYGMDREIIEFMCKVVKKCGRLDREPFDFEVFKLSLLYSLTPDIRGLVGKVEIPDHDPSHRLELTKLEKIRDEFHYFQTKPKPVLEPHISKLLDFIFAKIEPTYKYCEVVEYKKSTVDCGIEGVIRQLCDAVPKKDQETGDRPGGSDHVVVVRPLPWPERGYVASNLVYETFPELQELFESKDGKDFYRLFMLYIGKLWPKMQTTILDHVNAFAIRYFRWIVEMMSFPQNLPPEIRWKYAPMGTVYDTMEPPITPDPSNKLLLRLFHYQRNGKPKSKFVFIHEVRVILKKLKMLGVEFAKGGEPLPPAEEDEDSPVVHEIAEFTSAGHLMRMLQKFVPQIYDYVETVTAFMHQLTMVDDKILPIVSPYNSHCIPDVKGMERIMDILVQEVQIGRRIPLNFRCLEVLIRKMDQHFTGRAPFKTMVDRKVINELMKDATGLMEKYNGKVNHLHIKLGQLTPKSTYSEQRDAFLEYYPQFQPLIPRYYAIEVSTPEDYPRFTRPGEPELELIVPLIWKFH
ncbi:hypothetical protein GCK72_000430 [Caenorhabditis remanei]|uniref:Uncharacterized protein n=1 Tax=Caenorhabditis remanei TaxID=31234 RepID=A0A6A5HL48_CAERE|nr:hypothetical protein GCK72_000430 [Caenorhabditis remanei]KAF1768618.1 hypothetical protein GCK72_000430 [Caenorhabditis remanei]